MKLSENFVRALRAAENNFLQVLVSSFTATKCNGGWNLEIAFDDETPTIWNRHAKHYLRRNMADRARKCAAYQTAIDSRLLGTSELPLVFDDQDFPFRYASGGVLPKLTMGSTEYFSFFYRDVHPIGWNIANGGSDSRGELLHPHEIAEREFREELILLKPPGTGNESAGCRYVLNWGPNGPREHVEHAMARRILNRHLPELDVERLVPLPLPVEWLCGPDSVTIRMGGVPPVRTDGCILNINAEDFGIEIDKVARIYVDPDTILLDGEVMDQKLLGRPVGMFEVSKTLAAVASGASSFVPDFYFYNGRREDDGAAFPKFLDQVFSPYLRKEDVRTDDELRDFERSSGKTDLCPVTRSVLRRYSQIRARTVPESRAGRQPNNSQDFDVFICCSGSDTGIARRVYDYVTGTLNRNPFFYDEHRSSRFILSIEHAIESADCMILVASDPKNITTGYPLAEWSAFFNAIHNDRKPRGRLIPFFPGVHLNRIPNLLNSFYVVGERDIDSALKTLGRLMHE